MLKGVSLLICLQYISPRSSKVSTAQCPCDNSRAAGASATAPRWLL